ncbi:MAG: PAS domain S-box protein [Candidatus Hodarchaeota archaeon]
MVILHIDDNESFLELTRQIMAKISADVKIKSIFSPLDALEWLKTHDCDAIVSDYQMPKLTGLELLTTLREAGNSHPFIIFTGKSREEVAIEALNHGADYYLKKEGDILRLCNELYYIIKRLVERERKHHDQINDLDAKLKEAEYRQLWNIFVESEIPTLILRQDGKIVDYNAAMAQLSGYRHDEVPDISVWFPKLCPDEEYRNHVMKLSQRSREREIAVRRNVFEITCKNGTKCYVELSVYNVILAGQPTDLQVVQGINITAQKQMEEALRKSEEKYRSLVNNLPDVIWLSDCNGKTIYISPNVEKVYGYTSEEILQGGSYLWFGRIHPDDMVRVKDAYDSLITRDKIFDVEYRIQRKDGHWIWLHDRAIATYEEEGVKYASGLFSDITEHKWAEEALKASEERYRALLELAPEAIAVQCDGQIIYINPAGLQLFGASNYQEIIGKPVLDFVHPDCHESVKTRIKGIGENREQSPLLEEKLCRVDGRVFDAEVTGVPVTYLGRPGIQVFMKDITARKRAEDCLRQKLKDLEALYEASQAFLDPIDLETTLQNMCQLVTEHFDLKMSWVGLVVKDSFHVQPVSAYGFENGYLDSIHITWDESPTGWGPTGTAIRTGQAVPMNYIETDPLYDPWRSAALKRGYRSSAALPLCYGAEVLGVLNVYSATSAYFPPDRLQVLQAFANLGAVALQKAQFYQQIQQHAAKLEQRVTERTTELTRTNDKLRQEVAKRKQIDRELRESEEKFRLLSEQSIMGIVIAQDDTFKYVNQAAATIFEYSREEMLGWSPKEYTKTIHPDDLAMVMEQARKKQLGEKQGIIVKYSWRLITESKKVKWVETYSKTILFEGKPADFVTLIDITERKQAEEKLQKASLEVTELNESLKLINHILRHDIFNNLAIAQGYLDLYNDENDKRNLDRVSQTIKKCVNVITRMKSLEYLIFREEALSVYDARQTIDAILRTYTPETAVFRVVGKGLVLADPALPSVIDNLISNAIVHSNSRRIDITISEHNEVCEIQIADNGIGIPPEIKPKIFDLGFKHGPTGHMGLGLYIVKKVMERYKGSVRVENNIPHGSIFVLEFRSVKPAMKEN